MRKSNIRNPKSADKKIGQLKQLLTEYDRQCWMIADLVIDLIDKHRLSSRQLSEMTGYARNRLSEFRLTAKMFHPNDRGDSNFQNCLMARRVKRWLPRLNMSPVEIRDEIAGMCGKQIPQLKSHFTQLMFKQDSTTHKFNTDDECEYQDQWANKCINNDWRSVVPSLPDRSVKLFICDPPYGGYSSQEDGAYRSSRSHSSGLRIESDANNSKEALEVTLPLFDLCKPKLASGGCLLLFQPGGKADNPKILEHAKATGWGEPAVVLTWLKAASGIAAQDSPYVTTTERILVFVPEGSKLAVHTSGLSRSDVLQFPTITQSANGNMRHGIYEYGAVHMFQKPQSLMRFLVKKHTHRGDMVAEIFGCSGAGCIAAHALEREFIFVESNEVNFRWGSQRIVEAAEHQVAMAV